MAQIEDVARRSARSANDGGRCALDGRRVREERNGIEIALQRDTPADATARSGKIDRPIESHALRATRGKGIEPLPAPFREHDRGNAAPVGRSPQRRQHRSH